MEEKKFIDFLSNSNPTAIEVEGYILDNKGNPLMLHYDQLDLLALMLKRKDENLTVSYEGYVFGPKKKFTPIIEIKNNTPYSDINQLSSELTYTSQEITTELREILGGEFDNVTYDSFFLIKFIKK